jgi:predicted AlkP superfamily pyrophosphatase or phosphodiesterase
VTRRRFVQFCTGVLLCLAAGCAREVDTVPPAAARPILILVSLDGWRWDYLARFRPPTLTELAAHGVRSEGLIPVFPSKTFPNHYTIVTGLYPQKHGIVSNNMVDPALPGRFTLSNRDVQQDTRWWGGEPLWVTAERQGQIAATMFWPGSDVEIAGDRPTHYRMYEHELPIDIRVDQVLEWLDTPDSRRPTFLTLYFSDTDESGHDYGPDSDATRNAALDVDRALGRLLAGLDRLGLRSRTNLVVVSDHGMAAVTRQRTIVLDDYIDPSTVTMLDSTPILGLNPGSASAERMYRALRDKHPSLQVFTRENLPSRYRLRGHPRLPAVIGIADDGWHVATRASLEREKGDDFGGEHGYDPRHQSMHGLFVAAGPAFREGLVVPAFENIHLYELMCRVLVLRPAKNDGSAAATRSFLR